MVRLVADTIEGISDLILALDLGDAPIQTHPIGGQADIDESISRIHSRRARPHERIAVPPRGGKRRMHTAQAVRNGVGKTACFDKAPEFQGVIAVRRRVIVVLDQGAGRRIALKLQS